MAHAVEDQFEIVGAQANAVFDKRIGVIGTCQGWNVVSNSSLAIRRTRPPSGNSRAGELFRCVFWEPLTGRFLSIACGSTGNLSFAQGVASGLLVIHPARKPGSRPGLSADSGEEHLVNRNVVVGMGTGRVGYRGIPARS